MADRPAIGRLVQDLKQRGMLDDTCGVGGIQPHGLFARHAD
jgi:hypothetical protein